jgi:hypothetical protein
MHLAAAAYFALLLGGRAEPAPHRPTTHLWLESAIRPTPLTIDLKPPFELKSIKVVGATGLGLFVPISAELSFGVAATTFKFAPGQRAMQFVAAVRFRF